MTPTHRAPRRTRPHTPAAVGAVRHPGLRADTRPAESRAASAFFGTLSVGALAVLTFYGWQLLRMLIATVDAAR